MRRLSSKPLVGSSTYTGSSRPKQVNSAPTKAELIQLRATELDAKRARVKAAREDALLRKTAAKQVHVDKVQAKVSAVKAMKIDKHVHSRKYCVTIDRVKPDGVNKHKPNQKKLGKSSPTRVSELTEANAIEDMITTDGIELTEEISVATLITTEILEVIDEIYEAEVSELAAELSALTRAIRGMITPLDTQAVIFALATRVKLIELDCDEPLVDPDSLSELIDALALVIVLLAREDGCPTIQIMGEVTTVLTTCETKLVVEPLPEVTPYVEPIVQPTNQLIQPAVVVEPSAVMVSPQKHSEVLWLTQLVVASLATLSCFLRSILLVSQCAWLDPVLVRRFRPRVKLKWVPYMGVVYLLCIH